MLGIGTYTVNLFEMQFLRSYKISEPVKFNGKTTQIQLINLLTRLEYSFTIELTAKYA